MTSNGKAILNYTINQYIPLQSKTNYYSTFPINDTLNKGIYSDATKIKIGYYDGSGNLVDDTANWTITLTWSGTGTSRQ